MRECERTQHCLLIYVLLLHSSCQSGNVCQDDSLPTARGGSCSVNKYDAKQSGSASRFSLQPHSFLASLSMQDNERPKKESKRSRKAQEKAALIAYIMPCRHLITFSILIIFHYNLLLLPFPTSLPSTSHPCTHINKHTDACLSSISSFRMRQQLAKCKNNTRKDRMQALQEIGKHERYRVAVWHRIIMIRNLSFHLHYCVHLHANHACNSML